VCRFEVCEILFDVLTPHKLSEGCLEWCSFICVVFWLRCVVRICIGLCFELVDGVFMF
jgi:hypothetical protein